MGLDPHGALLGVGRSVVIDDFDLVRAAVAPEEDDAPLVVDPNAAVFCVDAYHCMQSLKLSLFGIHILLTLAVFAITLN
ncbi:hypothetical protein [Azospirillum doebereinerae]|uniref:hypothetical protein n=1 Tax=Azospirillum doebereinerae TaxID=92933 RepID=UPI00163CFA73